MIKLKNVHKIYPPDIVGVRGINLHVEPGEFISIVGQSGTGKSTLAIIEKIVSALVGFHKCVFEIICFKPFSKN